MTNINDRIELLATSDSFTRLVPGDKGTVKGIRNDGFSNVISVNWDSGSTLSLIEGEDSYRILPNG